MLPNLPPARLRSDADDTILGDLSLAGPLGSNEDLEDVEEVEDGEDLP